MLPVLPFLAPASVCASLFNKLLRREPWARERLSPFAGKAVQFAVGRWKLALSIQSSGYVQSCDPLIVPNVVLTVPAHNVGQLPQVLRSKDAAKIAALMHVQGDAGLAHVVSDLARELRWDIEDDLANVVGDVAALRLLGGFKSITQGARKSARRLAENASEYLSEESQLLTGRHAYEEWRAQVSALDARLSSLELRLAGLEHGRPLTTVNRL